MQTDVTRSLPSALELLDEPLRSFLNPFEPVIERLFSFDQLRQLIETARNAGEDAIATFLARLGITVRIDPDELRRIPAHGPVVAVANHPFGMLEGAILADALAKVRPDSKVLANSLLSAIPELRERCIFINPFGQRSAAAANAAALRECLAWLRRGGMIVTFPAGEVAHMDWKHGVLADPVWHPPIARLAQIAGATALPIFFTGANSAMFQIVGAVHPRLRTASLPRELLNKRGQTIDVRIGQAIGSATLRSFSDAREAIEYLRCRTYALDRGCTTRGAVISFPARFGSPRKSEPVAAAVPQGELAADVARLPSSGRLCEMGDLTAYVGTARELPNVLREIGRLREATFRKVGEGAGKRIDLDRFDRYYLHLFLWNAKRSEIVGAYRLGVTPDILPRMGVGGLYSSTLFHFRKKLFDRIGPAIELGRSFIRAEYQKQYAPLLLLWKGISRYVARRPECARLFGGVSVSSDYHPFSRDLIVKFLEVRRAEELASMVAPRRAYRSSERVFRRTGLVPRAPAGIDELSDLIAGIENDGKGVPILIKQYLKNGGRVLGFNVDRSFSNVLDALILVDLRDSPLPLLERYMGKQGADAFCRWHAFRQGAA